jgi:hypothetical protein
MTPQSEITPKNIICKIEQDITKKTWTTGALARDQVGESVPPLSPQACAWCELGWVVKTAAELGYQSPVIDYFREESETDVSKFQEDPLLGIVTDVVTTGIQEFKLKNNREELVEEYIDYYARKEYHNDCEHCQGHEPEVEDEELIDKVLSYVTIPEFNDKDADFDSIKRVNEIACRLAG